MKKLNLKYCSIHDIINSKRNGVNVKTTDDRYLIAFVYGMTGKDQAEKIFRQLSLMHS